MSQSAIICCCSLENVKTDLRRVLADSYRVLPCENRAELFQSLEDYPSAVLFYDPLYLSDDSLLSEIQQQFPDVSGMLVSKTNESPCYVFLQENSMQGAFPPDAEVSDRVVLHLVKSLLNKQKGTGLEIFQGEESHLVHVELKKLSEARTLLAVILEDFKQCRVVQEHDLHLAFDELINNAIFHAFLNDQGQEKYRRLTQDAFDLADRVCVDWLIEPDFAVISVVDNQGRLEIRTVLDRIYRQVSMEGLYDTSGRGLFITHRLASLLMIEIVPGVQSRVTLFFSNTPDSQPSPICLLQGS